MHTTTFRKVGGSVVMAVPPAILEILGIKAGDSGIVDIKDGQLVAKAVVQRKRRSKYNLSELLDNTDFTMTAEEREWLDSPAVGNEIL